jgi:ATP-dependent DNA ligase
MCRGDLQPGWHRSADDPREEQCQTGRRASARAQPSSSSSPSAATHEAWRQAGACGPWRKHKHRHRERLTITAWRPGDPREPDELLVSRRDDGGELRYAGGGRFGLSTTQRARLRSVLERLERPRAARSRVRRVQPVLAVDVDYHDRPGGLLRDAVLRNVALADEPPASHT